MPFREYSDFLKEEKLPLRQRPLNATCPEQATLVCLLNPKIGHVYKTLSLKNREISLVFFMKSLLSLFFCRKNKKSSKNREIMSLFS